MLLETISLEREAFFLLEKMIWPITFRIIDIENPWETFCKGPQGTLGFSAQDARLFQWDLSA